MPVCLTSTEPDRHPLHNTQNTHRLYRYFQARFPRLLMHCHGVCVRLLTRDKIFRTYIGGKEVEDDYEEDNASLGIGGGGGMAGVRSPLSPAQGPGGREDDAAMEGKGEEMGATGAAAAAEATSTPGAPAGFAPAPATVPKGDEELLARVTVFAGGTLATSYGCRGWWRPADHWARRLDAGKAKARPPHLTRQLTDGRYRTRLCQHWEASADPFNNQTAPEAVAVPFCPMRKRSKCDFAHSVVELRVKEGRRGRWGTTREPPGPPSLRSSGGEDAIAQARVAERSRAATVTGIGMGMGAGGGRGGGGGGGNRRPAMGPPAPPPPPPGSGSGLGGGGVDAPSWRRGPPQAGGGGYGGGYGGGGGSYYPHAPP